MMEQSRNLELKLISCKDLQNMCTFSKMHVWAAISISTDVDEGKQKVKTSVVPKCGTNHVFNFPVGFTLDHPKYSTLLSQNRITLDIHLFGKVIGEDLHIGTVKIHLKELFDSSGPKDMKLITRPVWRPYQRRYKGELTFSYKFEEVKPVCGYPLVQEKPEEKKNKSEMNFAAGLLAGLMIARAGGCGGL